MIKIMKILTLCILLFTIIALSGCILKTKDVSEQKREIKDKWDRRAMNLSDEEQQKFMEERKPNFSNMSEDGMWNNTSRRPSFEEAQQRLLEACNGKIEGDGCNFTGSGGEVTGICNIQKDRLICLPEGFRRDI